MLYASDVPIAAHFGLRGGDILAHWFPAYDVEFSRYSAGLIMHLRMAEFVGVGTVTTGSLHGAVLATASRARGAARRRAIDVVRRHPVLHNTAGWLRAKYRLARSGR